MIQVWAGNEDDCRDVTWEECNPVEKKVRSVGKCETFSLKVISGANVGGTNGL